VDLPTNDTGTGGKSDTVPDFDTADARQASRTLQIFDTILTAASVALTAGMLSPATVVPFPALKTVYLAAYAGAFVTGVLFLVLLRTAGGHGSSRRFPAVHSVNVLAFALVLTTIAVADQFNEHDLTTFVICICGVAITSRMRPRQLIAGVGVPTLCVAAATLAADPSLGGVLTLIPILVVASAGLLIGRTLHQSRDTARDLHAALVERNEELRHLSFHDSLTRIYNRRYFMEIFGQMSAQADRYGQEISVLLLDVDHFKAVNDRLGHAVGDSVLVQICSVLSAACRRSDVIARYGGEEIVVILPATGRGGALVAAEKLRAAVEAAAFPGVPWQVTVSVGTAVRASGEDLAPFMDRVDKAVYRAKEAGRNRVAT
jgi:diguanylate cyclase (GGDEF)-like protein